MQKAQPSPGLSTPFLLPLPSSLHTFLGTAGFEAVLKSTKLELHYSTATVFVSEFESLVTAHNQSIFGNLIFPTVILKGTNNGTMDHFIQICHTG